MKLYSSQQSKKIDELAIQFFKLPETFLIKRAGLESLKLIQKEMPECKKITIFCGTGNNGADGLMLAQYAYISGFEVEVIGLFNHYKILASHCQQIISELKVLNLEIQNFKDFKNSNTKKNLLGKLNQSDLIIDAIFGIGLDREVTGDFKEAIELINLSKPKVLSLDISSGLDANSGSILGDAINADATLTFIVHKFGLYSNDGVDVSGKVFFNHLGIKIKSLIKRLNEDNTLTTKKKGEIKDLIKPMVQAPKFRYVKKLIPNRKKNSHKNHFGSSLLIGGNHHMSGAIQLASLACLKVGVGLCYVLTRKKNAQMLPLMHPEIMSYQKKNLEQLFEKKSLTSVAIGPGLGNDSWAELLFENFLNHQKLNLIPSVIDADGLNLLSQMKKIENGLLKNTILSPHPKEAARLLGIKVDEVQNNRISAIKQLHQKYQSIIVLKGKGSLIYDGQTMYLCKYGNSGMACGGMGDVLTGIIAGLLAQNIPVPKAALIGTILHSFFADEAAIKTKMASLTPTDLIQSIQI